MKTRLLIIILGIVITISVIFATSFESPFQKEHYNIEIVGLKNTYFVGEPFSFSYVISGFGHSCGGKEATFPDENGELMTVGSSASCAGGIPMKQFEFDVQKEMGTTFGHVKLQNPGTYFVSVTFDRPSHDFPTTITKEFHVIENEDYCQEWCDYEELNSMGCDQPILEHLAKYSNLLDEEFSGKYAMEDIGLSDGISVEKFNECVDFIFEKRISYEFDATYGGLGNRSPAFLGWDIPDACTNDMVKFLKKHSNMFDNDVPYMSPLDGSVLEYGINADDIVQCENVLLDNRDNEPSWPGREN